MTEFILRVVESSSAGGIGEDDQLWLLVGLRIRDGFLEQVWQEEIELLNDSSHSLVFSLG